MARASAICNCLYRQLPGASCVVVVCGILMLGLWPFRSPKNDVGWLGDTNGISFGRFGSIQSSGALKVPYLQNETGGSMEIWVRPERWTKSSTVLTLFMPERPLSFSVRQALADIELEATAQNSAAKRKFRLSVDDGFGPALREKKAVFISVASGPGGTRVYLNGALAGVSSTFGIPLAAFTGHVVVGDSPRQPDSFEGLIRGLAFYDEELTGEQIFRHYQTWTKNGYPAIMEGEHNSSLYLFDEGAGRVIHSRAAAGPDLYIPERYTVANKISMEPFWREFRMSKSYWKNVAANVVGFIPVGFVFYGYFGDTRALGKAMLVTVVLGLALSLTIEILQTFLPTRYSGTTDLFTNTLGTYGGAMCSKHVWPIFTRIIRVWNLHLPSSTVGFGLSRSRPIQ